jgi:tetratricopeptide (TPR) repeat protein
VSRNGVNGSGARRTRPATRERAFVRFARRAGIPGWPFSDAGGNITEGGGLLSSKRIPQRAEEASAGTPESFMNIPVWKSGPAAFPHRIRLVPKGFAGRLPMALVRIAALGLLVTAASCASGPREPKPEEELQYGAKMGREGYWREARFRFERVVAREPSNARAHNNLAVAMEADGDFAGAFEEYKKAVALDSVDKSIHQNYTHFAEFYSAYTKKVGKVSPAP